MKLTQKTAILISIIVLCSLTIVIPVKSEGNAKNLVTATFNIEFETATEYKISVTADVEKIYLENLDKTHNKGEISTISNTNPTRMSIIQYALKGMMKSQIEEIFGSVAITDELPTYENGLFYDEYNVNLTSKFFKLNDSVNAHNLINGLLDLGAILNYSFNLQAGLGWNNTYIFDLGTKYGYQWTSGDGFANNINWKIENGYGNEPNLTAKIELKKNNPTTSNNNEEDIFIEFIVDTKNVNENSLSANIMAKTIDIRNYNALPVFVQNLDYVTADGLRLLIDNGLTSWDISKEKTINPIKEKIKNAVERSSFNQDLSFLFTWDNSTTNNCIDAFEISNMNDDPVVKAVLTDGEIDFNICGISSVATFGLINSGASVNISKEDINFGDNLNIIGYDYNVSFYLPEKMYLDGKNIYNWNESNSVEGKFSSDISNNFEEENKNTVIEIEFKTTDLNLLSFFTGNAELTFGLDMFEKCDYNVTTVPNEFDLPKKIILSNLCSDAFRLCVDENVFTKDEIDNFILNETKLFDNRLKNILPTLNVNGQANREKFDESLIWDKDITNMDAESAINIYANAHSSYPMIFDLSFMPPKFEIPALKLNFTGLQNQDVTYKIKFPPGITLEAKDIYNKAEVKKSNDQEYLEINFNESESNLTVQVSCKIIPSALFIVGIFIPCIISLIITIILIILIIILRRKRKGRGPKIEHYHTDDEEDFSGYEGEEFYVPPPPGSK